jgi:hypothetical protein
VDASGASGAQPAGGAPDPRDAEIQRLQTENDELRKDEAAEPGEPGSAPAPETLPPLEALKRSVDAHPDYTFVQHLQALADEGVGAVIDPAAEATVLRVVVALVADQAKVTL